MPVSTINTYFCQKPRSLDDLLEERHQGPVRVQLERIIQLTYEQYQHFFNHIWADIPFLAANKDLTYCDDKGVNHCLLVTARNIPGGILVDCQGCDFARYAAAVDISTLNLRNVPIDHYDLKLRLTRKQRERG